MSEVTPQKQEVNPNAVLWVWDALTASNDVGVPLSGNFVDYVDRTVQVEGDFDGATLHFEGSNDGVNFHPLTDPSGNPVSLTDADLRQTVEMAIHTRPRVQGAGPATSLVVTVAARKAQFR